jgi:Helix-turn-helix domain of resolvase
MAHRPIRGGLAAAVLARRAAGESAPAIARALGLDARAVDAYLARRAAAAGRRAWLACNGPEYRDAGDDLVVVEPAIAAEPPAAEVLELEQAPATPPAIAAPCGDWGSVHGGGSVPKLSPDDVARAIELHGDGVSIAELAEALGCSTATVKRALRSGR